MRYFITGFAGSGKSHLGSLWAADAGLPFYDLDLLIEAEERMNIPDIFSTYGEGYFREKEAAVLRNTDRFPDAVIACGGGTPCFFDNADWMNRNGVTVFLNETEEEIYHHVINEKKIRPLLKASSAEELKDIIKNKKNERMSFYEKAQIILQPQYLNRNGFHYIIQQSGKHA